MFVYLAGSTLGHLDVAVGHAGDAGELALVAVRLSVSAAHGLVLHGAHLLAALLWGDWVHTQKVKC